MIISEERVWAGSESNLRNVLLLEAQMIDNLTAFSGQQNDASEAPRLLSKDGGVATISIKGPLVNSDSPMLQFFGMTGYPEIRDALVGAAQDPEVKQILLDIDSGGGAVSGVDDTAALIRNINDKVKPVTTFTDGTMASAAYWLGSSAGNVISGKSAMVGSIGVIATHREYSEAYKKEGVGVTVVRAGKEKALANSNEKLTEKGRAQIQAMVDASYEIFVQHVADMRGKSYEVADKKMADGQEFIGKAAVEVGLTDKISTFDAVISDLKEKSLASSKNTLHNRPADSKKLSVCTNTSLIGDTEMARKALSEQEVAALAAGAAAVAAQEGADLDASTEQNTDGVESAQNVQTEAQEVVTTAESVVEAENAETKAAVQLLNSQLQAKDASLLEAGIKIAKLEERLADMQATHDPLVQIAVKSINNMQIALGGSAMSFEGASATAILEQHGKLSEQFQSKFKAGGISAVTGEEPAAKQPQVDPRHLARVNAVRFTSK